MTDIKASFTVESNSLSDALDEIKRAASAARENISQLNETVENVTIVSSTASEAADEMSDSVNNAGDAANITDEQFDQFINTLQDITQQTFEYKSSQESADESSEGLGDTVSKLSASVSSLNNKIDEATTDSGALTVVQKNLEGQLKETGNAAEEVSESFNDSSISAAALAASSLGMSGAVKAAGNSIDEAGDEADEAANDFIQAAGAAELLSLQTSALSINVGLFTIALRNLTTQVPMLVASVGNLTAAFTGLASAIASIGVGGLAVALGGALAKAEQAGANLDDFQSVMQSLEPVSQDVQEALVDAFMPVVELQGAVQVFNRVLQTTVHIVSSFSQAVAEAFNGSFIPTDPGTELQSLQETIHGILDAVNDNIDDITSAFARLTVILGDDIQSIIETALGGIPSFLDGVTTATEQMLNIIDVATDNLGHFITEFTLLGRTIAAGVAPVLNDFFGLLAKTVDNLILTNQEIQNFNDRMGIAEGNVSQAQEALSGFRLETIAATAKIGALVIALNKVASIAGSVIIPITAVGANLINFFNKSDSAAGAFLLTLDNISSVIGRNVGGFSRLGAAIEQILPPLGEQTSVLSDLRNRLRSSSDAADETSEEIREIADSTDIANEELEEMLRKQALIRTVLDGEDPDFDIDLSEENEQTESLTTEFSDLKSKLSTFTLTGLSLGLSSKIAGLTDKFVELADTQDSFIGALARDFSSALQSTGLGRNLSLVKQYNTSLKHTGSRVNAVGFAIKKLSSSISTTTATLSGLNRQSDNLSTKLSTVGSVITSNSDKIQDLAENGLSLSDTFDKISDSSDDVSLIPVSRSDIKSKFNSISETVANFNSSLSGDINDVTRKLSDGFNDDSLTFKPGIPIDDIRNRFATLGSMSDDIDISSGIGEGEVLDLGEDIEFNPAEKVHQLALEGDYSAAREVVEDSAAESFSDLDFSFLDPPQPLSEIDVDENTSKLDRISNRVSVFTDTITNKFGTLSSMGDDVNISSGIGVDQDDVLKFGDNVDFDPAKKIHELALEGDYSAAREVVEESTAESFSDFDVSIYDGSDFNPAEKASQLALEGDYSAAREVVEDSAAESFSDLDFSSLDAPQPLSEIDDDKSKSKLGRIRNVVSGFTSNIKKKLGSLRSISLSGIGSSLIAPFTNLKGLINGLSLSGIGSSLIAPFTRLKGVIGSVTGITSLFSNTLTVLKSVLGVASGATALQTAASLALAGAKTILIGVTGSLIAVFSVLAVASGVIAAAFLAVVAVVGTVAGLLMTLGDSGKGATEIIDGLISTLKEAADIVMPAVVDSGNAMIEVFRSIATPIGALVSGLKQIGVELGLISENAGSGGIMAMLQGAVEFVRPFIQQIGDLARVFGEFLTEKIRDATDAILGFLQDNNASGIIDQLISGFRSLAQNIKSLIGPIKSFVDNIMGSIMPVVNNLINTILGLSGMIAGMFSSGGESGAQGLVSTFFALANTLVSFVAPALNFISSIVSALAGIFNFLIDTVRVVMEGIIGLVGGVIDILGAFVGAIFESDGSGSGPGIFGMIADLIPVLINGFAGFIDFIVGATDALVTTLSPVVDVLSFMANTIMSILVPAAKFVGDIIRISLINPLMALMSVFDGGEITIKGFIDFVKNQFKELADALIDLFMGLGGVIGDVMLDVLQGLKNLAPDIMQGFIDFFNDKVARKIEIPGIDKTVKIPEINLNGGSSGGSGSGEGSGQSTGDSNEANIRGSNKGSDALTSGGTKAAAIAGEGSGFLQGMLGGGGDVQVSEGDTTNIFNQTISAEPEDEVQIGRIAEDAMAEANSFKRRQQGSQ